VLSLFIGAQVEILRVRMETKTESRSRQKASQECFPDKRIGNRFVAYGVNPHERQLLRNRVQRDEADPAGLVVGRMLEIPTKSQLASLNGIGKRFLVFAQPVPQIVIPGTCGTLHEIWV